MLNRKNDTAFWLNIVTAFQNLNGKDYVDAIAQLLSSMKQHQKDRWREVLEAQKLSNGQCEYGSSDPRLQHLAYVAEMVKDKGVDKALVFLIANDFVADNSTVERLSKKYQNLKQDGFDTLLKTKYKILLGDEYDEIIKNNSDTDLIKIKSILDTSDTIKDAKLRDDLIQAQKHRVSQKNRTILTVITTITVAFLIAIAIIQYFK